MRTLLARTFLLGLFILISSTSFSQWKRVNLGNEDSDMVYIDHVAGDTVYVTGGVAMFKTVNAGNTWTTIPLDLLASSLSRTHFFNSKKGVAVGEIVGSNTESVVYTADGAVTWGFVHIYNGSNWPREFHTLDFPSASTGYAAGTNGRIIKSTNNGLSWSLVYSDGSTNFLAADFDAASHGYILSSRWVQEFNGSALIKTVFNNNENNFVDISVLGAGQVFAVTPSKLQYTVNNGTASTTRPFPYAQITKVYARTVDNIYLGTNKGLYVTKDAGVHWELYKETEGTVVRDIYFTTSGHGYLVGDNGKIFVSDNFGGNNTAPIARFSTTTAGNCGSTSLFLNNESYNGYSYKWVIDNQVVSTQYNHEARFSTRTSGDVSLVVSNGLASDTLTQQFYVDVQNVHANAGPDVSACADERVYLQATSTGGYYYKWTPATGLSDPNIANPIATSTATAEYVVAISNDFGCTDKDTVRINRASVIPGPTWVKTNANPQLQVNDMQMISDTKGFALASNKLLVTNDAGVSWSQHPTFDGDNNWTFMFSDIDFNDPDTGFVVSSRLYKTVDGGETFEGVRMLFPDHQDSRYLNAGEFINSKVGYVAGITGFGGTFIYGTRDGGETWQRQLGVEGQIRRILHVRGDTLVAIGASYYYGSLFYITTDGVNWRQCQYDRKDYEEIQDATFINKTTGYAVGNGNKIWKTTDSGLSWNVDYITTQKDFAPTAITFINENVGFLGSWHSMTYRVLQTVNGGACWQDVGEAAQVTVFSTLNRLYSHKNTLFAMGRRWVESGGSITTPGEIYRTVINVGNAPNAPTGNSKQSFCMSAKVSNLIATGTDIKWYKVPFGGPALTPTTSLSDGTYYASQTVNGTESVSRLEVKVVVNGIAAPTGNALQKFCSGAKVSNLVATGGDIKWYSASTGGVPISTSTILVHGTHYYATQTNDGCESLPRLDVTASVGDNTPPTGSSTQIFCSTAYPGNLVANGQNLKWYATAVGGNPLDNFQWLSDNTSYYGSQTINGCESTSRLKVTVTYVTSWYPTAPYEQTFCTGTTVSALQATGTNLKWYSTETGPSLLTPTTVLINDANYYVTQTISGCESPRTRVRVFAKTPAKPTGIANQNFCDGGTLASIVANGTAIKWYSVETGGSPLPMSTLLVNGTTYYGTQTINDCESLVRLQVTTTVGAPIPAGNSLQVFCPGATVASLKATGTSVKWFSVENGGSPLASSTVLIDGMNYYASQMMNGCESSRLKVTVAVGALTKPTGNSSQTFCVGATIADLIVTGVGVKWYGQEVGGSPLMTTSVLTNNTSYFASQSTGSCESAERLKITAIINTTPLPAGPAVQEHNVGEALSDLEITGSNIKWYSNESEAKNKVNELSSSTLLENKTYFATQTLSGCEGLPLEVLVKLIEVVTGLGDSNDHLALYPNPVRAELMITHGKVIDHVTLTNALGQEVLTRNVNSKSVTLNTGDLTAGVYMVKIVVDGEVVAKRIVKVVG